MKEDMFQTKRKKIHKMDYDNLAQKNNGRYIRPPTADIVSKDSKDKKLKKKQYMQHARKHIAYIKQDELQKTNKLQAQIHIRQENSSLQVGKEEKAPEGKEKIKFQQYYGSRIKQAENEATLNFHDAGEINLRNSISVDKSLKDTESDRIIKEENTLDKMRSEQYVKTDNYIKKPNGKNKKNYQHIELKKTGRKPEKTQMELPICQRERLKKNYNAQSGKVRHRLQFEKEADAKNNWLSGKKNAVKTLAKEADRVFFADDDVETQETGQNNAALDAAHKTILSTEYTMRKFFHKRRRRRESGSYRVTRQIEAKSVMTEEDIGFQKNTADACVHRKKTYANAKSWQKHNIQKKYAAAVRESAKGIRRTGNILNKAGYAIGTALRSVAASKSYLCIIIGILLIALFGSLLSSCMAMFMGIQSAVLSSCYTADISAIEQCELRYTEMEADLQLEIADIEKTYPGYDEYSYNIENIGHNPYELIGYMSALYGSFTYEQSETELERLFGIQYKLSCNEVTEMRTYVDSAGASWEYEWHILKTTLVVKPLSEIIYESLPEERIGIYEVLMQTCGGRQCFTKPLDLSWKSYVLASYGYMVDLESGIKSLHHGIDIGVEYGSQIYAVQDGYVTFAGNAEQYGLCVIIENKEGYQSVYARCSAFLVREGQEVKRGDIIAAVGDTGYGSGTYLHLEVKYCGEYLNPYYFVADKGQGSGFAPMPDIAENPGVEMGDGSFETMLTEAEKYLGYPYVWGGSSPSTSFDCSGFVSWVINQSGVGNVGRQTAQGLYNLCTPVSKKDLRPGDLIFFTGTYSTANPVTHVGIYVGNGQMIHCGNPISYADINTNYWSSRFYSGGRLP